MDKKLNLLLQEKLNVDGKEATQALQSHDVQKVVKKHVKQQNIVLVDKDNKFIDKP
jgi:hypothetical protein